MQLHLEPPPDLRDPGDEEATARHLALLRAGDEPARAIGIEAARLLGDEAAGRSPGHPEAGAATDEARDRLAADVDQPTSAIDPARVRLAADVDRSTSATDPARDRLAADVDRMRELGARYWVPDRAPLAGRLGAFAPRLLFCRGLPDPASPSVAIVGTRHPDEYGSDLARRIAAAAAAAGAVVVSGGATGVDAIAHEAALDAGGRTVAVLGGGLGKPHPSSNRGLFDRIAAAGSCLVSEYPPSMPALRHHFPPRNRIVAALADAVVVVQAGSISGALITAEWGRRTGRPVFAVPADVWFERSAGCLALIRDGRARTLAAVPDLAAVPALSGLAEARWPAPGHRLWGLPQPWIGGGPAVSDPDGLGGGPPGGPPSPVLEALSEGMLGADELTALTGLPAGRVQAELLALEVAGRVRRLAGGGYVRIGGALRSGPAERGR
ncbi:MAG: DNA-protecting protein DprA [Deltaproteobacteria bacterium]|nr:DNA-protecting protein DprA [Deltaproteobacteria bacterium]